MTPLDGAPRTIVAPRVVLRAFSAHDAEAFDALVMSSIEHLLPWEPWAADEPHPLEQRRRDLADLAHQLAAGIAAHYAIERLADGALLGSAALVTGASQDRIELGYWLGVAHLGQGYATEASAALTAVALDRLRLPRVELWADTRNLPSNGVAQRLGYQLVGTEPSYREHPGEVPLMNVWVAEPGWRVP
ncbi:GNAT family N-acetyltransferase [Demequina sp. NBRC 110056]|uniref:GNAT family N-acetyltransferase n=1 Tax=Demequina sp. NBRC 110056 TaxID=1570345 RepID=UPI0013566F52|nr:GNAT family protein [Demequina sp. NBRC 110056]